MRKKCLKGKRVLKEKCFKERMFEGESVLRRECFKERVFQGECFKEELF